jgi:hypothetical protein
MQGTICPPMNSASAGSFFNPRLKTPNRFKIPPLPYYPVLWKLACPSFPRIFIGTPYAWRKHVTCVFDSTDRLGSFDIYKSDRENV